MIDYLLFPFFYDIVALSYLFFRPDFLVEVDPSPVLLDGSCSATTDGDDACTSSSHPHSSLLPEKCDEGGGEKEQSCDSLIMCIVTTLNQGLRNGGGIGDVLRKPSSKVRVTLVL